MSDTQPRSWNALLEEPLKHETTLVISTKLQTLQEFFREVFPLVTEAKGPVTRVTWNPLEIVTGTRSISFYGDPARGKSENYSVVRGMVLSDNARGQHANAVICLDEPEGRLWDAVITPVTATTDAQVFYYEQPPAPRTLSEAVAALKDHGYGPRFADKVREKGSLSAALGPGASFSGMNMRNTWNLWGTRPDAPKDLHSWFVARGLQHADDMSAVIQDAYESDVLGKEFDLDKEIQNYRDYWWAQDMDPDNLIAR